LKPFVIEYEFRKNIFDTFKHNYEKIIFIKKRMINSVKLSNVKFEILIHMWKEEAQRIYMLSGKSKNLEFKKLSQKLPGVD
jgi:Zn-dependent M32 family carboxypeptidase